MTTWRARLRVRGSDADGQSWGLGFGADDVAGGARHSIRVAPPRRRRRRRRRRQTSTCAAPRIASHRAASRAVGGSSTRLPTRERVLAIILFSAQMAGCTTLAAVAAPTNNASGARAIGAKSGGGKPTTRRPRPSAAPRDVRGLLRRCGGAAPARARSLRRSAGAVPPGAEAVSAEEGTAHGSAAWREFALAATGEWGGCCVAFDGDGVALDVPVRFVHGVGRIPADNMPFRDLVYDWQTKCVVSAEGDGLELVTKRALPEIGNEEAISSCGG